MSEVNVLGIKGAEGAMRVGGRVAGLNEAEPLKLARVSGREGCGMRGVAVKCIAITKNPDCEGSIPVPD